MSQQQPTLSVLENTSKSPTKSETFKIVDYPESVDEFYLPIDKFVNRYPSFPTQRGIEGRATNLAKVLSGSGKLAKHNEVDVLRQTGKTVKDKYTFVNGIEYLLEGHCRNYIFDTYLKGGTLKGTSFLELPKNVKVRVYEVDDAKEAVKLYNSINSVESVETTPHKVQGACRNENLLKSFQN